MYRRVMNDPRVMLEQLAAARGVSLSALSRVLGRNVAYLGQYVRRGTPRVLPERERGVLADFFGVDEGVLGAVRDRAAHALVPYLTIAAAAGAGRTAAEERIVRTEPIAAATLRAIGVRAAAASIIDVAGDSMAPGIGDGDRVLIDRDDRRPPRTGAVFAIRVDDLLALKRVRPVASGFEIASDNPAFATVCRATREVTVIGRARLLLRTL